MDIDGLGEQWSHILIDQHLVKDVADLYYLNKEQLLGLDRMGDRLASKIITNIEASKERPLPRLLFALGILHVGSEVAELLTHRFSTLDAVAQATMEDLTDIEGIGPKIAESIVDYFSVRQNLEVIAKLQRAGVKMHHDIHVPTAEEAPFQGLTFVVTGTLSRFTRRQAEERIKSLGGSVTSSVTRKTNYVVAGESPGSKLDTAGRLGTSVLDEAAFLDLLNSAASS
jgi:DNA ligase (NAD+)